MFCKKKSYVKRWWPLDSTNLPAVGVLGTDERLCLFEELLVYAVQAALGNRVACEAYHLRKNYLLTKELIQNYLESCNSVATLSVVSELRLCRQGRIYRNFMGGGQTLPKKISLNNRNIPPIPSPLPPILMFLLEFESLNCEWMASIIFFCQNVALFLILLKKKYFM